MRVAVAAALFFHRVHRIAQIKTCIIMLFICVICEIYEQPIVSEANNHKSYIQNQISAFKLFALPLTSSYFAS